MTRLVVILSLLLLSACDLNAGLIDIRGFGAIPNDGKDDTAAIQTAINIAGSSGGVVWIPKGVWDLTGSLDIGRTGVTLLGMGKNATILRSLSATSPVLSIYFGGVMADSRVEGMTIDGGPNRTGGYLLSLWNSRRSAFRDIRITRAHDAFILCGFGEVELSAFDIINPATADGVGITVGVEPPIVLGANFTIRDGLVEGYRIGVRVLNADAVFMTNTDLRLNGESALVIEPSYRSANHNFVGNYFDGTRDGPSVHLRGEGVIETTMFTGNWVASAGSVDGSSGPKPGVVIDGPGPRGQLSWVGGRVFNTSVGMQLHTNLALLLSGVQFSHSASGVDFDATGAGAVDISILANSGSGILKCGSAGVGSANRFRGGQQGC